MIESRLLIEFLTRESVTIADCRIDYRRVPVRIISVIFRNRAGRVGDFGYRTYAVVMVIINVASPLHRKHFINGIAKDVFGDERPGTVVFSHNIVTIVDEIYRHAVNGLGNTTIESVVDID